MTNVEQIAWQDQPLVFIIRAGLAPDKTTFLTPSDLNLQVGLVVYGAGEKIVPHVHLPMTRQIQGTSEVLVVKKGRCEMDIYSAAREPVATRCLEEGDVVLIVGGGHGFRMLENTILLEVKQGPYTGVAEKERF